MPVVAWVTVVLAVLIIFFAAGGLFRVVLHLKSVDSTLDDDRVEQQKGDRPPHHDPRVAGESMQDLACALRSHLCGRYQHGDGANKIGAGQPGDSAVEGQDP